MNYHEPVLLNESLSGLAIKSDGIYVDLTFGGGGHSRAILERLGDKGKLYAFDQDTAALQNAINDSRFTLINSNFRFFVNFLRYYKADKVDGVLADLGVSSYHFDSSARGFSFQGDEPLDMRMNQGARISAVDVVNGYELNKLTEIFRLYGELDNAFKLAKEVVAVRENKPITRTGQLVDALSGLIPQKNRNKFLSRVFQAIRIEVNGELNILRQMLLQLPDVLAPGGRVSIIAYHSLEDRLVKNFFRSGRFSGDAETDIYGNRLVPFEQISRKVIVPTNEEIERNSRARSAKLRIAERVHE